jgi:hypothetical protein
VRAQSKDPEQATDNSEKPFINPPVVITKRGHDNKALIGFGLPFHRRVLIDVVVHSYYW